MFLSCQFDLEIQITWTKKEIVKEVRLQAIYKEYSSMNPILTVSQYKMLIILSSDLDYNNDEQSLFKRTAYFAQNEGPAK